MSDITVVRLDTSGAPMKALADTAGMSTPEQAAFLLEGIATALHRGPRRDTWTSARERAARHAGVAPSMAKRIWQRWRDMRDVSGTTLIRLMISYEELCTATEEAADKCRAERIALRGANAAVDQGRTEMAVRVDATSG